MRKLLLLFIAVFIGISVVGCEDKDPSMAMERLEKSYKKLNPKGFNKFMSHWGEDVKGEDAGFSNYMEINEFYRTKALNNNVMGVSIEYYDAKREGDFVVVDYKEIITSAIDGKKVPLERVLRIWVNPLSSSYKVRKVKIMAIPEGAGGSFLE